MEEDEMKQALSTHLHVMQREKRTYKKFAFYLYFVAFALQKGEKSSHFRS